MCSDKEVGGLGFKKLREFNTALLSKQACHIHSKPDLLASKVLKARYFSNNSFLDADVGPNPNYAWRSLMKAQSLVRAGMRKLIEDENTKLAFLDPWLPDLDNPFPSSKVHDSLHDVQVRSLLNAEGTTWDEKIVFDVFNDGDANLICGLPLSRSCRADAWLWSLDPRGSYSVRSTYNFLRQTSNLDDSEVWGMIWSLKIPPKVKSRGGFANLR